MQRCALELLLIKWWLNVVFAMSPATIKLVDLILSVSVGLWNETNEDAQIAVSARLPQALHTLGLDKALGYLWMIPSSVCQMPTAGTSAGVDLYVPYHVSLGVPLYNSALCKLVRPSHRMDRACPPIHTSSEHAPLQVCQQLREDQLLSKDGIERQSASQVKALQCMASLVSICATAQSASSKEAVTVTPESLERQQFLLPTQRLLFDGHKVSCIDGWACTQGTAVQARVL
jgi:hypothetical protein